MPGETELTDLAWRTEFDAMDIDHGGTIDCGELMAFMKVGRESGRNHAPCSYQRSPMMHMYYTPHLLPSTEPLSGACLHEQGGEGNHEKNYDFSKWRDHFRGVRRLHG
jgi:hypothetical protein